MRLRLAAVIAVCAVAVGLAVREGSPPAAAAPGGASAEELAAELAANDVVLREAIDAWRAGGDPPTAPPPPEVMTPAKYLQGTVSTLAANKRLGRRTFELLAAPLSGRIRELTTAVRDLQKLSHGGPKTKFKVGKPRPLAELSGYYDEASQRYGIGQNYLAAIHHVETKFGRVKSDSVAGAQGPMQFIPSTWEIYGNGGNIKDPHDAILAAANLLRDNGAPADYRRALRAYNNSGHYVDAVQGYAKQISRDPYAIYYLYCWGP